ncbi:MAG: DEAD/DEAH box helicase, partial [Vagococcus sp.]
KAKKQISDYATVLAYQQKKNVSSQLLEKFSQKNKNANLILSKILDYKTPEDILMQSTTIKPKYQEKLLNEDNPFIFKAKFDYEFCLEILQTLFIKYDWENEEDLRGLGKYSKLPYYAVLMTSWISSKSLNMIIQSTIKNMERKKFVIYINHNPLNKEVFKISNPIHLNQVINDLLRDIEGILRFKVKNYVINYLKLTNQDDGEWQNYLEYGTNNKTIIELQKIGFERQIAIELNKYAERNFKFNSFGEIIFIDVDSLLSENISRDARNQIKIFL